MSDKRYEANIIRTTAVEPANNLQSTSAPGVWSLDEVMELQKKNKWPTAGNVATDVDEVFSCFLYTGDGTDNRAISNGIDLSGEGGLVWIKNRDYGFDHLIGDTERGITKGIRSNTTAAENNFSDRIKTVTSTGFTLGTADEINSSNTGYTGSLMDYVSWTFRKASKFFDVVTYTGNFTAGKTVSHNLGSVPGMIWIKRTDNTSDWIIYHRSIGEGKFVKLNTTDGEVSNTFNFNNTAPTSTQFTLGESTNTNTNGATYVAYLFAHNNNDGGFGPNQDQDIIKCGSYTGNGTDDGSKIITLGFEPQWIFLKRSDGGGYYSQIIDSMRGMVTSGNDQILWPNVTAVENGTLNSVDATSTGFSVNDQGNSNLNGSTWIYMAIRRGSLAQPTAGTQVFAIDKQNTSNPRFTSGFPVDFALMKNTTGAQDWRVTTRLLSGKYLKTNSGSAEVSDGTALFDFMDGHFASNLGVNWYSWMWKRAPGYSDVVAYEGTGSATTVTHNLGVAPEMMWVKQRNITQSWNVYHQGMDASAPQDYYMQIDSSGASSDNSNRWNDTAPTSSVFTIGTAASVNGSGGDFIAYLFATVAGVSKVGSYTGNGGSANSNGTNQDIDCGFTAGARFVIIKSSSDTGDWFVYDTERGIVAGNDAYVKLNVTDAQQSNIDSIDPLNSGFSVRQDGTNNLNVTSREYIFYAIA